MSASPRRVYRALRSVFLAVTIDAATILTGLFGSTSRRRFTRFWARVLAWCLPSFRARLRCQLSAAGYSDTQQHELSLAWFQEVGANLADLLAQQRTIREAPVVDAGLRALLQQQRDTPLLVVSAHLGNWELLAARCATATTDPIHVLARAQPEPALERALGRRRAMAGIHTIHRTLPGLRRAKRVLLSGGTLGVLADHRLSRGRGHVLQFLGRPALTSSGPARLAIATDAEVWAAFLPWRDGAYRLELERVPRPESTSEDAVELLSQSINDAIGRAIRRNPAQWSWFHRRFEGLRVDTPHIGKGGVRSTAALTISLLSGCIAPLPSNPPPLAELELRGVELGFEVEGIGLLAGSGGAAVAGSQGRLEVQGFEGTFRFSSMPVVAEVAAASLLRSEGGALEVGGLLARGEGIFLQADTGSWSPATGFAVRGSPASLEWGDWACSGPLLTLPAGEGLDGLRGCQ